jgi:hypothetical protein
MIQASMVQASTGVVVTGLNLLGLNTIFNWMSSGISTLEDGNCGTTDELGRIKRRKLNPRPNHRGHATEPARR